MRSKTNDRKEDCVVNDWTNDVIVHPLKMVAGEMAILAIATGFSVVIGTIGVVRFVKNRLIG